jgi:tRNA A37 threonylcarbamoyladenosine synthetase subunit TsaC/SUA5/YrdC
VPRFPERARAVLERVGVATGTSANLHGGPDPSTVADVPPEVLAGVGAVVDCGRLLGTPSTVLDLTGPEPVVIREGAVPAAEALAALVEG